MKTVRLNIGILISMFCGLATLALAVVPPAKASCGSTTCFLVIGSQA